MLAQEIIRRKRNGHSLTGAELEFMANGIATGTVSEGQIAAFAMAVFFCGMSIAETATWTEAMTASGTRLQWPRDLLAGPLLDKHSTGGVGDKVSLVLAPLLAACGAYVPMISGRGLGHTGGTLDKLEAIPGYCTQVKQAQLAKVVHEVGCAIVGATDTIAPADRRLYSIRDVTATIDSVPLITASILSKKLAAAVDSLVLDVKTGSGAFVGTFDAARELAESLVAVGNQSGLNTAALVTDMDQVLGRNAGNAVEVEESIAFLCNDQRDPRLEQLVTELGSEALLIGGLAKDDASAKTLLKSNLDNGAAAERFQAMVVALGGPADLLVRPGSYLPKAVVSQPVFATTGGVVQTIDVRRVGMVIVSLGGGRRQPGEAIDSSVGLTDILGIGETVSPDQPLAIVHARSESDAETAAVELQQAFQLGDTPCHPGPVVLERIK
ncbi:MAG: thymidine phosphorylase [Arenicellales bacterium]|nr:thymidine phosphorylase [Arenicellales bacterium]